MISHRGAWLPSARERVRRQNEEAADGKDVRQTRRRRLLMSMYNIGAELKAPDLAGETTQTGFHAEGL